VSGVGRVSSWIVVRRALHPAFENEIPYVVAEVDLAEGIRVLARTVNLEAAGLRAGLPVRATFRDVDERVSLLLFEPV
jgi:uncharacterized OB-fold protein